MHGRHTDRPAVPARPPDASDSSAIGPQSLQAGRSAGATLTRRTLFKRALLGAPALLLPGRRAGARDEDDSRSPRVTPFRQRLPIPRLHLPLNRPDATPGERARAWEIFQQAIAEDRFRHPFVTPDESADYYELVARPGVASIIPGLQTPVWGFNGHYPGATFVARRNRTIVLRLLNRVGEIVSLHHHGGHTPADSDGTPMLSFSDRDTFAPGAVVGSRTYVYPNDDEFPATRFYHDHGLDVTGPNVYRGLSGFFLLKPNDLDPDDAQFREADAALPAGYGRYDIPLMFQDRSFNRDGSLYYNTFDHDGFIGDRFLVNGAIQPYLPVARRKYRFRLLNAANARYYELFLSSGDSFVQTATEGALLPAPIDVRSIRLAPAERAEIVIDFSRWRLGEAVHLVNGVEQDDGRGPEDDVDPDRGTPMVEFRVHRDEPDPSWIPDDLNPAVAEYIGRYLDPDNPVNPAMEIPTRRMEFGRGNGAWQINDRFFDRNRVDVYEHLNTQSIWRLENSSGGWVHPLHIHDMQFLMLDRNGRPPRPGERGLKDVFDVGENETVRVMAYWSGPQNIGRYVFHCHNLEHEDMAMMGIFEVLPPGQPIPGRGGRR
jgi:FtsP/CotA-like multicopper oxidase with cupredoxin domain